METNSKKDMANNSAKTIVIILAILTTVSALIVPEGVFSRLLTIMATILIISWITDAGDMEEQNEKQKE